MIHLIDIGIMSRFEQANYGAAKAALVGSMNVFHLEGGKNDIRVNAIASSAATGMARGLFPEDAIELLQPEAARQGCSTWRARTRLRAPSCVLVEAYSLAP